MKKHIFIYIFIYKFKLRTIAFKLITSGFPYNEKYYTINK